MRRISIASGINNVRYEKRKHIDESDLNPILSLLIPLTPQSAFAQSEPELSWKVW